MLSRYQRRMIIERVYAACLRVPGRRLPALLAAFIEDHGKGVLFLGDEQFADQFVSYALSRPGGCAKVGPDVRRSTLERMLEAWLLVSDETLVQVLGAFLEDRGRRVFLVPDDVFAEDFYGYVRGYLRHESAAAE